MATAQVNRNDVVIDEIMADPSPARGLPDAEFLELRNVSPKPFNLIGWKILDATATATINANFVLQPDSLVILCSTAAKAALSAFGATLAIAGFPSLNNDGELISLRANDGRLVHAVAYSKGWYGNSLKSEGGWTLEMIDPENACNGAANWKASTAEKGGTPGKKNSVDQSNPDQLAPVLLYSYAADSLSLVLCFDESLDSAAATGSEKYLVSDGIGVPRRVMAIPPLFTQVVLYLNLPLQKGKLYTVSAKMISDCSGNTASRYDPVKTALPSAADAGDVVINELLFNPKPDGVDYIELYNRSNYAIDFKELWIANRTTSSAVANMHRLATDTRLLFPGEYLVATENAQVVQRQYLVKNAGSFAEIAMPSYPDDKGTVVLLNSSGKVVDELNYDEKWQFKLIDHREGVALERIDYNKPTQEAANWHSASTTAGYGTPTYRNSQFGTGLQPEGTFTVNPPVFSPDNDGWQDYTTILYQLPEPGWVCNISLFNVQGVAVRLLVRNAICGTTGYFRWDGLDEKGNRLPSGTYIMLIDVFNLTGKTKRNKQAVTLARKPS